MAELLITVLLIGRADYCLSVTILWYIMDQLTKILTFGLKVECFEWLPIKRWKRARIDESRHLVNYAWLCKSNRKEDLQI